MGLGACEVFVTVLFGLLEALCSAAMTDKGSVMRIDNIQ